MRLLQVSNNAISMREDDYKRVNLFFGYSKIAERLPFKNVYMLDVELNRIKFSWYVFDIGYGDN